MTKKNILISTIALIVTGCATHTPIRTAPRDHQTIISEAEAAVGKSIHIAALEVRSDGMFSDAIFRIKSKMHGSSSMAKLVAGDVLLLENKPSAVMLYGPNSHKTMRVSMDALNLLKRRDLHRITFLFCGTDSDFAYLKDHVQSFQGKLLLVHQP